MRLFSFFNFFTQIYFTFNGRLLRVPKITRKIQFKSQKFINNLKTLNLVNFINLKMSHVFWIKKLSRINIRRNAKLTSRQLSQIFWTPELSENWYCTSVWFSMYYDIYIMVEKVPLDLIKDVIARVGYIWRVNSEPRFLLSLSTRLSKPEVFYLFLLIALYSSVSRIYAQILCYIFHRLYKTQ